MTLLTNAVSLYKSQTLSRKPLRIENFPLLTHQKYTLKNNKPVLIHFWAIWCPTCKLEAPNIEFLSKHYEVLTIIVQSGNNETIEKYLSENGYTFPVVNDKNGTLAATFGVFAFPTTFIYDKTKELRFSEVGYTSTLGLYLTMLWAGK